MKTGVGYEGEEPGDGVQHPDNYRDAEAQRRKVFAGSRKELSGPLAPTRRGALAVKKVWVRL